MLMLLIMPVKHIKAVLKEVPPADPICCSIRRASPRQDKLRIQARARLKHGGRLKEQETPAIRHGRERVVPRLVNQRVRLRASEIASAAAITRKKSLVNCGISAYFDLRRPGQR
jgi:hypothetical protein